jgi:hypothetical protein
MLLRGIGLLNPQVDEVLHELRSNINTLRQQLGRWCMHERHHSCSRSRVALTRCSRMAMKVAGKMARQNSRAWILNTLVIILCWGPCIGVGWVRVVLACTTEDGYSGVRRRMSEIVEEALWILFQVLEINPDLCVDTATVHFIGATSMRLYNWGLEVEKLN